MKIVLATKNQHKAAELSALTAALAPALSLRDWELEAGQILAEAIEDGASFLANALIKARHYASLTGLAALADDSGLSVSALGGAPGVLSARYGGAGLSDEQRCVKLLSQMRQRRDRRAFFTTVLVLAKPDASYLYWRGRLPGFITYEARGANGFGYDPIFRPQAFQVSLAQLSPEEKNAISHRARAAKAFAADLPKVRHWLTEA